MKSKLRTREESVEIIEPLGEGLNSRVFKAFLKPSGQLPPQIVALKIFKSSHDVQNFQNTFQNLVKVRSRYCVGLLGWTMLGAEGALIMDYVEGLTLEKLLRRNDLTSELVDELVSQTLVGLQDLHRHQIFHGDLNLNNVMVDTNGQVKIIDYGLWSGNKSGETLGTPAFMSESRLKGEPVDMFSDYFSLGMIRHYLQTKQVPSFRDKHSAHKYVQLIRSSVVCPLMEACEAKVAPTGLYHENELAREKLAQMVRGELKSRIKTNDATIRLSPIRKTKTSWARLASSAVALLVTLSSYPQPFAGILNNSIDQTLSLDLNNERSGTATIEFRTLRWHEIELNGKQLGFTPLKLENLKAGRYVIRWSNSTNKGFKLIHVSEGQSIRLSDLDLL